MRMPKRTCPIRNNHGVGRVELLKLLIMQIFAKLIIFHHLKSFWKPKVVTDSLTKGTGYRTSRLKSLTSSKNSICSADNFSFDIFASLVRLWVFGGILLLLFKTNKAFNNFIIFIFFWSAIQCVILVFEFQPFGFSR